MNSPCAIGFWFPILNSLSSRFIRRGGFTVEWTVTPSPDGRYVIVVTSGRFDPAGHRRMTEDILSREFWRPGMDALFDHRLLDFGGADFPAMVEARDTHKLNDERIGDGKAAIVVKSLADFGVGRMFQSLAENQVRADLQLFQNYDDAVDWIERGNREPPAEAR